MQTTIITRVLLLSSLIVTTSSFADNQMLKGSLIPGNNGLYYEIGGGETMPLPYAPDETDINISVLGNAGVGYNCGAFNQINSIANSINGIKNSFTQLESQVVDDAKGAILELPAYELAKHMPNAYRLLQDGVANGQFDFGLSTKSCQEMVSQVGQGQNPYHDWMEASMGDKWKHYMSFGNSQAVQSGLLGDSYGDINQAKQDVDSDSGKSGVQWFTGVSQDGGLYAGGQGQPVIQVVTDTVIAGYNTLIGQGRSLSDKSAPSKTDDNERITLFFPASTDAANWITTVVGEQTMSTYSGGQKQSVPGRGLSVDITNQVNSIKPVLTGMVQGTMPINLANLKAISTNTVAINEAFIRQLQNINNVLTRAMTINSVAEWIAEMRVLNKAKLAMSILQVGSEEPVVISNKAAAQSIAFYIQRLQYWIDSIRLSPKDNSELMTSPILSLMNNLDSQQRNSAQIQPSASQAPIMQQGAIHRGNG